MPSHPRLRRALPALIVLLLLGLLNLALFVSIGSPPAAVPVEAQSGAIPDEVVVARVFFKDRAALQQLADMGYDVLEHVNRREKYASVLIGPDEWRELEAAGYRVERDAELSEMLSPANRLTFFGGYRTVEELYALYDQTAAQYPAIAQVVDYGDSWEKVTAGGKPGYDLKVMRITNRAITGTVLAPGFQGITPTKPVFFFMSNIHSRELTTAEMTSRFVKALTEGYGVDADLTWLVDHHEIWVVLTANPDGYKVVENPGSTPLLHRKNTNNSNGGNCSVPSTSNNHYGTDLNRNASYRWGGASTSTNPCDAIYRGPHPASEPEEQALEQLMAGLFQDQRGPGDTDAAPLNTTGTMLSLHSFSNLVLWPWGWSTVDSPNDAQLEQLGLKMASYNGYTGGQPGEVLYDASGTTDDWAYGTLGVAGFTFEIGPPSGTCGGFFPAYACQDGFWALNRPAFLYLAKVARSPYQTPFGPDASELSLTPGVVSVGTTAVLQARINDATNGGQPIAAASYWIDTPDWVEGAVARPLMAADGAFNSADEVVTGIIETDGLTPGRHLLFVRGRDSAGNWGPVTATFLFISTGEEGTLTGEVREAGSNAPLAATVTVLDLNLTATTDPATGRYSVRLPAGTYSVRASAPQHLAVTVAGVVVSPGLTVTQNFVLTATAPILLVDGDKGNGGNPNVEGFYTAALDALGRDYDRWETGAGGSPSADTLRQYEQVIWFTGEVASLSASEEAELTAYLESGGKLFLVGQDYLYEHPLNTFVTTYLQIAGWQNDRLHTALVGVSADPIGGGLGPYTLSFPANYSNYADTLTPGTAPGTGIPFRTPGGENVAVRYENTNACFRTVFFGFAYEALPTAEARTAVMDRVLRWLDRRPDFVAPKGVGVEDVQAVAGVWGSEVGDPGWNGRYDLNGDNRINVVDITLVSTAWGQPCP